MSALPLPRDEESAADSESALYEHVPLSGGVRSWLIFKVVGILVVAVAFLGGAIVGCVFIALGMSGVLGVIALCALVLLLGLALCAYLLWFARAELSDLRGGYVLRFSGDVGVHYLSSAMQNGSYLSVTWKGGPELKCERLKFLTAVDLKRGEGYWGPMTIAFTPHARELVELSCPKRNWNARL